MDHTYLNFLQFLWAFTHLNTMLQTRIGGRESDISATQIQKEKGQVSHEDNSRLTVEFAHKCWPIVEATFRRYSTPSNLFPDGVDEALGSANLCKRHGQPPATLQ